MYYARFFRRLRGLLRLQSHRILRDRERTLLPGTKSIGPSPFRRLHAPHQCPAPEFAHCNVQVRFVSNTTPISSHFSYSFQSVQERSEKVWRFYRYYIISSYYDTPSIRPPFLIFAIVYRVFRYVYQKCTGQRDNDYAGLRGLSPPFERHT